jgi:hypothetical protein
LFLFFEVVGSNHNGNFVFVFWSGRRQQILSWRMVLFVFVFSFVQQTVSLWWQRMVQGSRECCFGFFAIFGVNSDGSGFWHGGVGAVVSAVSVFCSFLR